MGCSDETKNTVVKLAVDILPTLVTELGPLLLAEGEHLTGRELEGFEDGDRNAEFEKLMSNMNQINNRKFMDNFHYSYNGSFSVPVNAVKDRPVQGHTDVVSVKIPDLSTAMPNYVDNTLITKGSVPSWAAQAIRNDILNYMNTYITGQETSWQVHNYTNIYPNPQPTAEYPAFAMDGQILFGIFDFQQPSPSGGDPITVPSLLLSYIGVSYPSFSWGDPIDSVNSKAVVRYSFAASTLMIGFAVAAYIYRLQPNGIDMLVANPANGSTVFKLTIGQKGLGGPIDTAYVDQALSKAGVTQISRSLSVATSDEMQSFAELGKLEGP
ncbi:hypothetical protein KCU61_g7926, partial [Aureobasidium melanogenum]